MTIASRSLPRKISAAEAIADAQCAEHGHPEVPGTGTCQCLHVVYGESRKGWPV